MNYKRPPIVEAIIDLKFSKNISDDQVLKAGRKLSREYTFEDEANNVNIHVDLEKQKLRQTGTRLGRRFTSIDRTDITILTSENIIFSRLAPYQGWDQLIERTKKDWSILTGICGAIELSRLGVRYINRIDLEIRPESTINIEDYFKIYPQTAALELPAAEAIAMQIVRPLGALDALVTMNMASVPSPLLNHVGFILDFDIGISNGAIPQRDSELWQLADQIRIRKNELFERSITDSARELFGE